MQCTQQGSIPTPLFEANGFTDDTTNMQTRKPRQHILPATDFRSLSNPAVACKPIRPGELPAHEICITTQHLSHCHMRPLLCLLTSSVRRNHTNAPDQCGRNQWASSQPPRTFALLLLFTRPCQHTARGRRSHTALQQLRHLCFCPQRLCSAGHNTNMPSQAATHKISNNVPGRDSAQGNV